VLRGGRHNRFQSRTGPRKYLFAIHLDLREFVVRQTDHHALDTTVQHQQVRAATDHRHRNFTNVAVMEQARQVAFVGRLDPKLGRAAHAH